jgi:FkbM family methyltransferase
MSKISGIEARNGKFLYPTNDTYIGKCMEVYGEWEEELVQKCIKIVPPGGVVVEVGSNIGTHTVPIARHVGDTGKVYAIEPQRLIFQILCANLVCNEVFNVEAYHAAAGDKPGSVLVPDLDIGIEYNFGAVRVAGQEGVSVPLMTVDSLNLERCDLLKVDAEDFEPQVLLGSFKTIEAHKPVIYLEYNPHVRSTIDFYIKQFLPHYRVWSCNEVIYKANNYFESTENHYDNIHSLGIILSTREIAGVTDSLEALVI